MKKYHYVYRITNIILNKHYYGVRTSKNILPKDDLGIKYFSSSRDKDFINEQKRNPQNHKYKIIQIFNNRKKALEFEIKLHNKFDVGINESFYNRSKQTSSGWDTTGCVSHNKGCHLSEERKEHLRSIFLGKKKQPLSQETKDKISKANKGKVRTPEHKEKLRQANLGKKLSDETKDKIRNGNLGKQVSEETGLKISKAKKGWVPSDETRALWSKQRKGKSHKCSDKVKKKLSQDRKGKQLPQSTCPHCGKTTSVPLLNRWHLDNCKFKINKD